MSAFFVGTADGKPVLGCCESSDLSQTMSAFFVGTADGKPVLGCCENSDLSQTMAAFFDSNADGKPVLGCCVSSDIFLFFVFCGETSCRVVASSISRRRTFSLSCSLTDGVSRGRSGMTWCWGSEPGGGSLSFLKTRASTCNRGLCPLPSVESHSVAAF